MLKNLQKACKFVNSAHKSCEDKFLEGQLELIAMNLYIATSNAKAVKACFKKKKE